MKRIFLSNVRLWLGISLSLLLIGCGGGSDGPRTSAPSSLNYQSPQVFVMSQPIGAMSPTVTGTVSSYAVNPALPAGLSLNATSGAISGTPTSIAGAATYTVTASNSAGSTSASVAITVTDVAPVVSYGATDYTLTTGVPPTIAAISTGGPVVTWSVNPALPAGLTFNSADGSIGGIPTEASNTATYVVTAQNSGGSDTVELTIAVDAGVVLELGHGDEVEVLRRQGDRILSQDEDGHWILWNSQTAQQVAQGDTICSSECDVRVDLAGQTFVVQTNSGLELRSPTDGSLVGTITAGVYWWKLASDGSYVAIAEGDRVSLWSRTGTLMLSQAGNYVPAMALAVPNELRVVNGPAGGAVVQIIAVPSGTVSTDIQYLGQFHAWFAGGTRFLTTDGNTVRVYSVNGGLEDTKVLSGINNLSGLGQWFWVTRAPGFLDIYTVGASASPAASYDFGGITAVSASGNSIGVLDGTDVGVVDLNGASPARVDYVAPVSANLFSATSSADWVVANRDGVVVDIATTPGTPNYFSLGSAWDIASGTQYFAVATAAKKIVYFDAVTRQQAGVIDFAASKLDMSADGTVLAAGALNPTSNLTDLTLKIFSLPTATEVRSWPATTASPQVPTDFSLSASGEVIGRVLQTAGTLTYVREVSMVSGGAPTWTDSVNTAGHTLNYRVSIRLSPSGSLIAVPDRPPHWNTATNVFNSNGSLAFQTQGWAQGWIDEDRLLVARYQEFLGSPRWMESAILSSSGQQLQTLTLTDTDFQTVTADSVYIDKVIRSLSTGVSLWTSGEPTTGPGAVTSSHVIFASRHTVRAEPY